MTQQAERKKTLLPLGNRVLLKRMEDTETMKGGILLPDSAKKKQETAEVISVGKGKVNKDGNLIPMPVKVGDIVLMDKYSHQEVTVDDVEYIIVSADDIIAIVE